MIRYLLFATVGTGLFWVVYRWLLRRERCLGLNRAYLLLTLVLSLLLPLWRPVLSLPVAVDGGATGYWIDLSESAEGVTPYGEPETGAGTLPSAATGWSAWRVVGVVYWVGVAASVLLMVVGYVALWWRMRRYRFERREGLKVAIDEGGEGSFSLFRHIVVGSRGLSGDECEMVLAHERAHAMQGHSWDRLLARLVGCLLWFDPFVWLYGRDLREVHEYLADEAVLRQGGEGEYKSYLRLLYRQVTGARYVPVVNSFYFPTIKNRITMMKQPKSRRGWVKALAALPVAALLMFANCKNQEPAQQQAAIPDGQYLVWPFTDTYRDGQLVEREYMGVLLPLEELDKHKVFADSAEAARYSDRLVVEGKAVHTVSMVNLNDSAAARWYDVAWADDRAALSWWDEEDGGKFELAGYPGGLEAMSNYIAKSVVYPEKAKADGMQGMVYVQFVVDTDGNIADATVLHGVGGECDDEALRVVRSMPKWRPAMFKGKPVRSKYVLPINFKLQ